MTPTREGGLNAARARKLPRLETFAAKYRTSLGGTERYGRFFSASRTVGGRFHAFPSDRGTRRRAGCSFGLARFASLRLVLEILVGEEELFTSSPNELGAAIYTIERLVLELHRSFPLTIRPSPNTSLFELEDRPGPSIRTILLAAVNLFHFPTLFLARSLARERLLRTAPIARLQIERVLLDILDDIFLLHLPFEAAKRALNRFAFLYLDFSHA
ncbi:MAG TPA: hypothetical protein VL882_10600 [Vicinamibacterales bacterium]|jgi:hypothetical protein|nr:hypothetical protein [Vicinamibacterales bacterium]